MAKTKTAADSQSVKVEALASAKPSKMGMVRAALGELGADAKPLDEIIKLTSGDLEKRVIPFLKLAAS